MKIEIRLKEFIFSLLLLMLFLFTWANIIQIRNEVKFSQNMTAIVNQLNANTNDIKNIAAFLNQQAKPVSQPEKEMAK